VIHLPYPFRALSAARRAAFPFSLPQTGPLEKEIQASPPPLFRAEGPRRRGRGLFLLLAKFISNIID